MPLFRRRPPPSPLPLVRPALDGTGWPDRAELGRTGFEAATTFELGERRAADLDALGLAERLADAALPRLRTGVEEQDAPYLHKTFLTAARLGAGIGLLAREAGSGPEVLDRRTAAALWLARERLPRMRQEWERVAAWFVLAGHWAARTDEAPHATAIAALVDDVRA